MSVVLGLFMSGLEVNGGDSPLQTSWPMCANSKQETLSLTRCEAMTEVVLGPLHVSCAVSKPVHVCVTIK